MKPRTKNFIKESWLKLIPENFLFNTFELITVYEMAEGNWNYYVVKYPDSDYKALYVPKIKGQNGTGFFGDLDYLYKYLKGDHHWQKDAPEVITMWSFASEPKLAGLSIK